MSQLVHMRSRIQIEGCLPLHLVPEEKNQWGRTDIPETKLRTKKFNTSLITKNKPKKVYRTNGGGTIDEQFGK